MFWYYNDTIINDIKSIPDNCYGFIYLLHFEDGTKYIGKKQLYSHTTLPALKSGQFRENSLRVGKNRNGKRVYFDVVKKESNWKTYEGSIKKEVPSKLIKKEIIDFAFTSIELTYLEVHYQCRYDVLRVDNFLNDNILGKFYKGRI